MDIELIKEFILVAQHGNLSQASDELHISQPVLSRHLAAIEKEVGAELLDRTTTPMRPTPIGKIFIDGASEIYGNYQTLIGKLRRIKPSDFKTIRIGGLLESAAAASILKAKNDIGQAHETWTIERVIYRRNKPNELLENRELDIVIEPASPLFRAASIIESRPICKERMAVVASAEDPLHVKEGGIGVSDIANRTVVTRLRNDDFGIRMHVNSVVSSLGLPGQYPSKMRMVEAESFNDILMVGLNGGILVLPESVADAVCSPFRGRYTVVPIEQPRYDFDIRAFFRSDASDEVLVYVDALTAKEEAGIGL